jgi:hypothetical protein
LPRLSNVGRTLIQHFLETIEVIVEPGRWLVQMQQTRILLARRCEPTSSIVRGDTTGEGCGEARPLGFLVQTGAFHVEDEPPFDPQPMQLQCLIGVDDSSQGLDRLVFCRCELLEVGGELRLELLHLIPRHTRPRHRRRLTSNLLQFVGSGFGVRGRNGGRQWTRSGIRRATRREGGTG